MRKKIFYMTLFLVSLSILFSTVGKAQHKISDSYSIPKLPMVPADRLLLYIVIKENFNFTLSDNVTLSCSRYYPNVPNPGLPNGYPAVIICHGFGDRKEALDSLANA